MTPVKNTISSAPHGGAAFAGLGRLEVEGDDLGVVECDLMIKTNGNTITGDGTLHTDSEAILDVAKTLGSVTLFIDDFHEKIVLSIGATYPDGTMKVTIVGYRPDDR